jgi:lipopolysaccharide export system protein LptA
MNPRPLVAFFLLVLFSTCGSFAWARVLARVAVLPFEIHSAENLDHLKEKMVRDLSALITRGGQIVTPDESYVREELYRRSSGRLDRRTLEEIAQGTDAHFIVFGSLTKIKENLSLDVYTFSPLEKGGFAKDYAEGKEIDSLMRDIALKLNRTILAKAGSLPEIQSAGGKAELPESQALPSSREPRQGPEETLDASVREETIEEIPERGLAEAGEELPEEIKVAALPPDTREEEVRRPPATRRKEDLRRKRSFDQPVRITSDTLEADNRRNVVAFKGNVVARQEDMVIFSDTMTVDYDPGGGLKKITAEGNVRINQEDRIATGKKVVFYNPEQKIVLTGDPRVWQGDNLITGDRIVVLLEEDRVVIEGGSEGRVSATIYPKEIREEGAP